MDHGLRSDPFSPLPRNVSCGGGAHGAMNRMDDIRDLADEEVMQLVQQGDPRAFELLYDRHGGAAFSLAYRMVGDRTAAEDVAQEAFLSIWRSRLRYQAERGSVRTWVLGVVHHRAIDSLRRNLVHQRRRASAEGIEERHEARELTDVEAARRESAATCAARSTRCPRSSARSSSWPTSAASATARSRTCSRCPSGP